MVTPSRKQVSRSSLKRALLARGIGRRDRYLCSMDSRFRHLLDWRRYIEFPVFLIAVAFLLVLRRRIQRRLLAWCVAAPVAVVIVWLAADYVNYSLVDFSFLEFIWLEGVMLRAALVFVCASFSSCLFYFWSRNRLTIEA